MIKIKHTNINNKMQYSKHMLNLYSLKNPKTDEILKL